MEDDFRFRSRDFYVEAPLVFVGDRTRFWGKIKPLCKCDAFPCAPGKFDFRFINSGTYLPAKGRNVEALVVVVVVVLLLLLLL